MGGTPAVDVRGLGTDGRATDARLAPKREARQRAEKFSVQTLPLMGPNGIPPALAYGLEWQLEFLRQPDPPGEYKKQLAKDLLDLWKFLVAQELTSPRADDGALLMDDWRKSLGSVRGPVTFIEVGYGQYAPVAKMEAEPLDPWAPAFFPPDTPAEVRDRYPPRPSRLDDIPPFFPAFVKSWVLADAYVAGTDGGPPPTPRPDDPYAPRVLNDVAAQVPDDPEQLARALEDASRSLDVVRLGMTQANAARGETPNVNKVVATLQAVTLDDIGRQTGVQFAGAHGDVPLHAQTELILYHTVYSFVLDKRGEPSNLNGRLDYPILVGDANAFTMQRHCPPPSIVCVSVQKYGYANFRIEGGQIHKMLLGGPGGFTEYGYGYSGPHELQTRIQGYLDSLGRYTYIAGITAPAALEREEITFNRIRRRLADLASAVLPYLEKEMRVRAQSRIANWQAFLKEIAGELIRDIIIDAVKDRVRSYLIKKIGARIIPGVNVAFAVYDLVTGDTERMRMRNALACIYVVLESDAKEDMTIAAKVAATIVADAFEDKIIEAIIAAGKKAAGHIALKAQGKGKTGQETEEPEAEPGAPQAQARQPQTKPTETRTETAAERKPAAASTPPKAPRPRGRTDAAPPSKDTPSAETLTASGPKAPAQVPAATRADTPDARAEQAVADMKRRIQEDLRSQGHQAVAGSSVPPVDHNGTVATAATASAAGKDDKALAVTGTTGTGTGNRTAGDTQAAPARRRRRKADPQPPPQPISGSGTLEDPHVYPPGPRPSQTIGVKQDPQNFEPGLSEVETPKRRLSTQTNVEQQGSARDSIGDPVPPWYQRHHEVPQGSSGGVTGERMRESLRTSGLTVNEPEGALPARGVNQDVSSDRRSPAVTDSVADHTRQHGAERLSPLEKRLNTTTGDDDAQRAILRDTTHMHSEGRVDEGPEFYLDSQMDSDIDVEDVRGTRNRGRRDPDEPPPPRKPPSPPPPKTPAPRGRPRR